MVNVISSEELYHQLTRFAQFLQLIVTSELHLQVSNLRLMTTTEAFETEAPFCLGDQIQH